MAGGGTGTSGAGGEGAWQVFLVFLRLGLTSFGGPIAHLAYFREALVLRRRWLSESAYADLVALCQVLPGPASSQVGLAIGLSRAGIPGLLAAWCGFTLPSAILLAGFAIGLARWGAALPDDALHGLKLVAVVVVAHAVWGMGRMFCTDAARVALALAAAGLVLAVGGSWIPVGVIALGAAVGPWLRQRMQAAGGGGFDVSLSRRAGAVSGAIFLVMLGALPLLAQLFPAAALQLGDAFFRSGALVFGGGHVVLPLLQAEVVEPGWMDADTFLAGYGAAQAVPGPLFTVAAFLGAAMPGGAGGWGGALLCLVAIFLPSMLLVLAVLPYWPAVRQHARARGALAGVNAVVVGLLLAALYDPLWTTTVRGWPDLAWILGGLVALGGLRWPAWVVVALLGVGGFAVALGAA